MIKLYIFDMGGVLAQGIYELDDILKDSEIDCSIKDLYQNDITDRYSSGLISEEAYWTEFNSRYGTNLSAPQWGKYFLPVLDKEVSELILQLKEKNRVVCGTNVIAPHWEIHQKNMDYSIFDKVYPSHFMGIAKPHRGFWRYILEQEKVLPEETVFIDDGLPNVEAAASLGINAVHFTKIEKLRKDLIPFSR